MINKPSKEEAQKAIRTLLEYIGENPDRDGLKMTPHRVIKSYSELYSGYSMNIDEILSTKFFDIAEFHDFIVLKDIRFKSTCEHHMLPIVGKVDIAYMPSNAVVGISKLARVVEVFARRLQIQEKMTAQIAESIQKHLNPEGVAVRVAATHFCMSARGVQQDNSIMDTTHYTGIFAKGAKYRQEFIKVIN